MKRKSSRVVKPVNHKNIKKSARDKLKIKGLSGTLGSNLSQLASDMEVKDKKSTYFNYLCKNSIIDITNVKQGSQMKLLGGSAIGRALIKYMITQLSSFCKT